MIKITKGHFQALCWILVGLAYAVFAVRVEPSVNALLVILITSVVGTLIIRRFGLVSAPSVYVVLFAFFHFATVVIVLPFQSIMPDIPASFLDRLYLNEAIAASVCGLFSLMSGFAILRPRVDEPYPMLDAKKTTGLDRSIFKLSLLLLAAFTLVYLFYGLKSGLLIQGKQLMVELRRAGTPSTGMFGISSEFIVILTFISLAYAPHKYVLPVATIPLILHFPLFITGQRGFFILLVASLALVVHKRGIKIPTPVAIFVIPAGLWVTSALRALTKSSGQFASEWYLNAAFEMGKQIEVVVYTIDAINENITDFWLGASYFWGVWRIVPNIAGIRNIFERANPNGWITEHYGGVAGLGNSIVAEAFLNFGWPGTFLVPFLVGIFLARFEIKGARSRLTLAVYGATLGGLFFAVRNDMGGVFRTFVWSSLTVLILIGISKYLSRRL